MREPLNRGRVEKLMAALGAAILGSGRIYFTGGVTALLFGWRESTIDADLCADPEPAGFFESLPKVKLQLNANLEMVSPADFLPELPGWRSRSLFIARHGRIDFHHYDFYSQALTKILRHHERDRRDLQGMSDARLIEPARLRELFDSIKPKLVRYPKIDPAAFEERLAKWIDAG
ncbi:MAG TPA: hypothetical protein VGO11_17840 [Chthoniobacteraceae bacterium]|jgi:hypothetical protein|nr:hypothetical protein [Chthoniobacteraceae bacterium]